MYENPLKDFGYDIEVNKGAFKDSIKKQFDGFGLEEQSDSKNKIFVFPEGMQKLLRDAFKTRDYQSEALLFAKVAKICRSELFGEETAFFSGSFPEDCQQNLLPLTLFWTRGGKFAPPAGFFNIVQKPLGLGS